MKEINRTVRRIYSWGTIIGLASILIIPICTYFIRESQIDT